MFTKKNFESKILVEKTIKEESVDPNKLSEKSNKFIWVSCRYCGEPNRVRKSKFSLSGGTNAHKECRRKELSEVKSTFSLQDTKDKIKKSLLEKYGVDHSSKIQSVIEKRRETSLKNYGFINPSMSDVIKKKKMETVRRNYGVDYPLQSKEILEKYKKTNLEKYNHEFSSQNEDIKTKTKEYFEEKFGFDNPMKNETIKEKSRKKMLKFYENHQEDYKMINCLRKDPSFWNDLSHKSIKKISEERNFKPCSLRGTLMNLEFKDKYLSTYSFPKTQVQKEIYDYIVSLVGSEVTFNDRKTISPLELDIYIPEHKLAIEFNGSYWHSEMRLTHKEAMNKHKIKTDLCKAQGIRLIHIFEHDWIGNEDVWKKYIKNILGLNERRIFARKCVLSNADGKALIKRNHLQGTGGNVLRYFSLENNGEVVATMTANKHHRQNGDDQSVVLGRLVFADGTSVVGGSSKLFSEFKKWAKENGYKKIVSWSDNSYSQGDIYGTLGFVKDKEYGPDYFYFDFASDCYRSKQSQKKSVVDCPLGMTESEWCESRGLFRIWDCGKIKWIFDLKD